MGLVGSNAHAAGAGPDARGGRAAGAPDALRFLRSRAEIPKAMPCLVIASRVGKFSEEAHKCLRAT
jgi:hypothetical protein